MHWSNQGNAQQTRYLCLLLSNSGRPVGIGLRFRDRVQWFFTQGNQICRE